MSNILEIICYVIAFAISSRILVEMWDEDGLGAAVFGFILMLTISFMTVRYLFR